MDENLEEMYADATSQDDRGWRCFCGDETVDGHPVREHTVSEHNKAQYEATHAYDAGCADCINPDPLA